MKITTDEEGSEILTASDPVEVNLIMGLLRRHKAELEKRLARFRDEVAAYGYGKWPAVSKAEHSRAEMQLQRVNLMLAAEAAEE
jgi:hypothetical protein